MMRCREAKEYLTNNPEGADHGTLSTGEIVDLKLDRDLRRDRPDAGLQDHAAGQEGAARCRPAR
jgi:hypothetical protein